MLHSRAAEIEYVIFLIEALQDLVQLMMEYIEENKRQFTLREKNPKRKKKPADVKAELQVLQIHSIDFTEDWYYQAISSRELFF